MIEIEKATKPSFDARFNKYLNQLTKKDENPYEQPP